MLRFSWTSIATVAVAAAAITSAHPATAKQRDNTNNVNAKVIFSDLDITREAGARVLLRRIKAAAIQICGGRSYISTELFRKRMVDACVKDAMTNAIDQLNAPKVKALYN